MSLIENRKKIKPRPNDRNMPAQHIATLLGATCCAQQCAICCVGMLRSFGRGFNWCPNIKILIFHIFYSVKISVLWSLPGCNYIFFLCTKAFAFGIHWRAHCSNLLVPRAFPKKIWRSTGERVYKNPSGNCHVNFGSNLLCKINVIEQNVSPYRKVEGRAKKRPKEIMMW